MALKKMEIEAAEPESEKEESGIPEHEIERACQVLIDAEKVKQNPELLKAAHLAMKDKKSHMDSAMGGIKDVKDLKKAKQKMYASPEEE